MNSKYDERYFVEHEYIPHELFSGCKNMLLSQLQNRREEEIYYLYSAEYEGAGKACPYSKDQFKVEIVKRKVQGIPEFSMILIGLPKPECPPLCSKLMICYGRGFENPGYFTVEKAFGFNKYMLCCANEMGHLNYGEAPKSDDELFAKVDSIYSHSVKAKHQTESDDIDKLESEFRQTAYKVIELLSDCRALSTDANGDNIIDQTSLLLLEMATIAFAKQADLIKQFQNRVLPLFADACNVDNMQNRIEIYTDVLLYRREPKATWLKEADRNKYINMKKGLGAQVNRTIAAFGDFLLCPDSSQNYYGFRAPRCSDRDLEELKNVLYGDVRNQITEFSLFCQEISRTRREMKSVVTEAAKRPVLNLQEIKAKHCYRCGRPIGADANFCSYCGAEVPAPIHIDATWGVDPEMLRRSREENERRRSSMTKEEREEERELFYKAFPELRDL